MTARRKQAHVKKCEDQGLIADSLAVRLDLLERVKAREITLSDSKARLRSIQRKANKNGLMTRAQAYNEG